MRIPRAALEILTNTNSTSSTDSNQKSTTVDDEILLSYVPLYPRLYESQSTLPQLNQYHQAPKYNTADKIMKALCQEYEGLRHCISSLNGNHLPITL
jgi:hypothetical protein